MRESILELLYGIPLGTFQVSKELPYDETGVALYTRNPKTIYVDFEVEESLPLFITLDRADINTTTSSVAVYFSTDAKQIPPNLNAMITAIKGLKMQISDPGANRREVVHSTEYVGDLLTITVEFRFTRIT
jgi:hypothetical protein